jgi:hypothetical protein
MSTGRPAHPRESGGGRGARRALWWCGRLPVPVGDLRLAVGGLAAAGGVAQHSPHGRAVPHPLAGARRDPLLGQPPGELRDRDLLLGVATGDLSYHLRLGRVDLPSTRLSAAVRGPRCEARKPSTPHGTERSPRRHAARRCGWPGGTSTMTIASPSGSRATISIRPQGLRFGSSSTTTPAAASRRHACCTSRT